MLWHPSIRNRNWIPRCYSLAKRCVILLVTTTANPPQSTPVSRPDRTAPNPPTSKSLLQPDLAPKGKADPKPEPSRSPRNRPFHPHSPSLSTEKHSFGKGNGSPLKGNENRRLEMQNKNFNKRRSVLETHPIQSGPESHGRARMKSSSRHPRPKMQTQATIASAQTKLRKRNPSSC